MKLNFKKFCFALICLSAVSFGTYANNEGSVSSKQVQTKGSLQQDSEFIKVSGKVVDESNEILAGAAIIVKGTSQGTNTNKYGDFTILCEKGVELEVSFMGMISQVITAKEGATKVVLKFDNFAVEDAVVTGIFNRRNKSFTGAAKTISSDQLKAVGNQNVIQSLKNLDPSLFVMDNLDMGSNPNSLPQMQMRGMSSLENGITSTSLKGNYQSQPNQPLFILDGFETSAERIFDLDMNRVKSVTLLKDASAKAIYGSKAANGVIVIETLTLEGDKPLVSYVGSVDFTMPDLTSYNLASAAEKLEVERIEGVYEASNFPDTQIKLWKLYEDRLRLIEGGLNTDWISKPLRTGVGHKHNVMVEVGDAKSVRAAIDFTYNKVNGVMKDSGRENIAGGVNLSYRVKNLIFRNIMRINNNVSNDSPYGTFGDYAELNPYWMFTDPLTGGVARWAEASTHEPNPYYDGTIGTLYKDTYLSFTNNLYAEWLINSEFKLTGRLGIDMKRSDSDTFLPANHSTYSTSQYIYGDTDMKMQRGSYAYEQGKGSNISADVNANYNKSINGHNIFANLGAKISESKSSVIGSKAIGFPSNKGADLNFAKEYARGQRPTTFSSLNREISFLAFAAYDYKSKYLVEATYRVNASSLFGTENRWSPGWSTGLGWNVHNESFLKDFEPLKRFKIRGSIGVTGNQNFDINNAIATYHYFSDKTYQGLTGSYLSRLANEDLVIEQRQDMNIGFDLELWGLTASFDYYNSYTQNMLTDVAIPTSTGFSSVKENLGTVMNDGIELMLGYTIFRNENGFINVSASFVNERNTIKELSKAMQKFNENQSSAAGDPTNSVPVTMYYNGLAMNTIWAVPSLGIDPMTGNEIYLKKDGSTTMTYDPLDLVAAGNRDPKYRGNASINAEYKGFGLNFTCRYLAGGDMYNQTLVDRVENIDINKQVDRRVLLGRWQTPGQDAQFKRLQSTTNFGEVHKTQATTRFIQKRNEFDIATISVYYEFSQKLLRKSPFSRLKAQLYMNEVAKFSSIQIERGLSYPFARSLSFSLTATF